MRELKRDIETTCLGTQAATTGAAASASVMAGVASWLWTNQVQSGASSTTVAVTSGAPKTAPTAGTAAAFTEAQLKSAIALAWTEGGDPQVIMTNTSNKQTASGFSGIATQYRDNAGSMGPAVIVGAADVYISDFGTHYIVANRFQPTDNVYVLDLDYWDIAYLRPIQQTELAKTGDSDRRLILAECTLRSLAPSSNAKIYTTT